MNVILAIFMRKFVVRRCYGTAIYCVKKYFDFVVSDDIFVDSRLFYCRLSTFYSRLSTFYSRLSTFYSRLSTFYSRLSTFTLDSRLLLSTLDFYSRLSTFTLDSRPSTFRYTHFYPTFCTLYQDEQQRALPILLPL